MVVLLGSSVDNAICQFVQKTIANDNVTNKTIRYLKVEVEYFNLSGYPTKIFLLQIGHQVFHIWSVRRIDAFSTPDVFQINLYVQGPEGDTHLNSKRLELDENAIRISGFFAHDGVILPQPNLFVERDFWDHIAKIFEYISVEIQAGIVELTSDGFVLHELTEVKEYNIFEILPPFTVNQIFKGIYGKPENKERRTSTRSLAFLDFDIDSFKAIFGSSIRYIQYNKMTLAFIGGDVNILSYFRKASIIDINGVNEIVISGQIINQKLPILFFKNLKRLTLENCTLIKYEYLQLHRLQTLRFDLTSSLRVNCPKALPISKVLAYPGAITRYRIEFDSAIDLIWDLLNSNKFKPNWRILFDVNNISLINASDIIDEVARSQGSIRLTNYPDLSVNLEEPLLEEKARIAGVVLSRDENEFNIYPK